MKTVKKITACLLTLLLVLTTVVGGITTAHAEETAPMELKAVKDGENIVVTLELTETVNFGGFGGNLNYDHDVFKFTNCTWPDDLALVFNVNNDYIGGDAGAQGKDFAAETVIFTATLQIIGEIEPGKDYAISYVFNEAYNDDLADFDWMEATVSGTYSEAPSGFTITWLNDDGTELEKDENVAAGTMPSYDGETPTKAETAQYTYTFAGWDPEPVEVTENATYTATYNETVKTYTVTWVNYDGAVLETDENVPYGTTPTYDGETPVKPADEQNTYTFTGWDPAVAAVEGDVTYTAQFTAEEITYWTLTFKDAEGEVLTTKQVADGQILTDVPTVEAPEGQYLKGWAVEAKFMGFINALRAGNVFDFANTPITMDMTFVPVFENRGVDLSSIVITKVLAGDEYEGDEPVEFTFVITPVDGAPAIEGTFKVSTADDPMTVTLPENAIFEEGGTYTYEVTEEIPADTGDWQYDETKYIMELLIEPQNTDGKLGLTYAKIHVDGETDKTAELSFTNTYRVKVAPLTIKNLNTDNVVEGTKFAYSIVFDTTFTDGQTTYTKDQSVSLGELGDEESVTINNIPVGTGFTITESTGETFYTHEMLKGEIISEHNSIANGVDLVMTGIIVEDPNTKAADPANYVEVENDLVYETGTLKITKEVTGEIDPAYSDKEFTFTITFTVPEAFANVKILDKDGVEVDGTVTFTLKAGESYDSFTNIPVGTTYTLTEAAEQYFVATYKTANGDEGGNTEANKAMEATNIEIVKDENTITVTNEYTITPPTGVTIHTEMILILALVLVAMIGSVVLTKKLRRA